MKNNFKTSILFLTMMVISAIPVFAQHDTVPNPGMENWTCPSYCDPTLWNTDNVLTHPYGGTEIYKETAAAHVHSGLASAKIETQDVIIENAPGTITTGTINSSNQTISGGCAMNYRPLKFKLWYQYAPSGTDTFVVNFTLFNSGNAIGSANFYTTSTVSAWTQLSMPIAYTPGSLIPDQMQIIIASGTGNNSNSGSTAYVDDLSLVDCSLMSVSATPTAATCTQSNGSIVAAGAGTTSPYTYLWSNTSTAATISGITPATYSVVATDADGCTASASASVTTSNVPFGVAITNSPETCATLNGTSTASATGGATPYTYVWSNTATSASITGLADNTYTVIVTDNNGCSSTGTSTVTQVNQNFTVTPTNGTTACGSNTGTVSVTATLGTPAYTYAWSNGTTTAQVTGLGATTLTVTVTDAHGCTTSGQASVSTPNGPSASDVPANLKCYNDSSGSVTVTETGGTGNITYLWSNGATTVSLANVAAATYTLTITDINNCSFALSATLTQPTAVINTVVTSNVSCFGGSNGAVTITPSGGTSPYTTNLLAGGTAPVSNLAAGVYTYVIIDANQCTDTTGFSIIQPTAITFASPVITGVSCNGGSNGAITASATGGTGSLTYAWASSTSSSVTGLAAGSYVTTVTDANSCTASASYSVTQPATALAATLTPANASGALASDGSDIAAASGGTSPYTYSWANTATTATIINLTPALYCVTVSDANHCTTSGCDTVNYTTGINTINAALIKIYPNPANNQLTIETSSVDGKFMFTVYSLDGKMVDQKTIAGEKSTIQLDRLAAGFYMYQLKDVVTGDLDYGKFQIQR